MSPEERARMIAEYDRQESRYFKAADDLKEQAARRESEGYQAGRKAQQLRDQIAREDLLAPFVSALRSAEETIVNFIGMYGDSGAGLVLQEVRAALAKAEAAQ